MERRFQSPQSETAAAERPPKRTESRESESVSRQVFEYRDAQGNLLGRAEAEFDDQDRPLDEKGLSGEPVTGKRLRRLILRGEKGGQLTEIDALALTDPRGTEILVSSEPNAGRHYYYNDENRRAVVPPLDNLTGVAVMLHELGHAEQHGEEKFQQVEPHYQLGRQVRDGQNCYGADVLKVRETLRQTNPELADALNAPELDRLKQILEEIGPVHERVMALEGERDNLSIEERKIYTEQLLSAAERQIPSLETIMELHEADAVGGRAGLAKRLEALGFVLPEARPGAEPAETPEPEDEDTFAPRTMDWKARRPAEPETIQPISAADIGSAEAAASLCARLRNIFEAQMAYDLDYRPETGEAVVKFIHRVGPESRRRQAEVRLNLSEDERKTIASSLAALTPEIDRNRSELSEAQTRADALRTEENKIAGSRLAREIVLTPKRLMERNATARALHWSRRIREMTGIDLFAAYGVTGGLDIRKPRGGGEMGPAAPGGTDRGDCVDEMERSFSESAAGKDDVTDILEQFHAGLESHGDLRAAGRVLKDVLEEQEGPQKEE